jgi:phosphatidate cytidylyltransferase
LVAFHFVSHLYIPSQQPFQQVGMEMTGLFYCVMPFALLCYMGIGSGVQASGDDSGIPYSPWLVLGYFFIVWSNDVFAYFIGRSFGRRKLFERLSPHKTWEGFWGGLAASLLCAFLFSRFFDFLSLIDWLVMALLIAVFGTLGDLTESMLKRSRHIKDSGHILPGHGGFLDRFDATLIAAPIVFVWIMIRH